MPKSISRRAGGLFALWLIASPLLWGCHRGVDVSSDEAVARAIGADPHHVCVDRPPELPGIVLTGTFANDRGCMDGPIFVAGHEVHGNAATQAALAHLGWAHANRQKKLALATRWAVVGLMHFDGSVLTTKPANFNRPFHPPKATVSGGTIHVALWGQDPGGMVCGTSYSETTFAIRLSDGAFEGLHAGPHFFVPCHSH